MAFLRCILKCKLKTQSHLKVFFLNKAIRLSKSREFTVYLTVYNVKFFSDDTSLECSFETRQCFLENTSEGDDFDWALNSVSTII